MSNRMQKQRKNTNNEQYYDYEIDCISSDVLAAMSDEELIQRRQDLDALHDKLTKAHCNDVQALEVELAFVQREFQLRHARHEQHGKYVSAMNEDMVGILASESSLPNVDFSNVDFVRLYAEYQHNLSKRARC